MKSWRKSIKKSRRYKILAYRFFQATRAPYFFVTRSRPATHWRTRNLIREYTRGEHSLDAIQSSVLENLRQNGIALTHLADFFGDRANRMLEDLQNEAERLVTQGNVHGNPKKSFLFYFLKFWRGANVAPDIASPFVRFAIEPRILTVVGEYFHVYPILHFLSAAVSRVVPPDTPEDTSQRWHRDPGSDSICKVFLYLNDVDEGTGPFMYIAGSQPGGRLKRLFPHRFFGVGSYYPDFSRVERAVQNIGRENVRIATGRAGTMIFCNTLGLHRGGYATKKERLMVTCDYQRVPPSVDVGDMYLRASKEFEREIGNLDPISRRALL